jgi:methyl-accepting chemotaxis protein
MAPLLNVSCPAAAPRQPGSTTSRPDGATSLWKHHGIWHLGVLMFRRMNFPSKAMVISVSFLLVVAQLAYLFVRTIEEGVAITQKELKGVAMASTLLPLISQTQAFRHHAALAGGKAPELALLAQMDQQLGALEALSDPAIDLVKPLKFVRDGLATLRQPLDDADEAFRIADEVASQSLRLMASVADESGLSLDPGADSYHLMLASTSEMLELMQQISRMRDVGLLALRSGSLTPAQHGALFGDSYVTYRELESVFSRYERVVKANPALAEALAFQDAFTPVNGFMRLVRKNVLAEAGPRGDAAAFEATGKNALAALLALVERSHKTLGEVLQARIDSDRRARNLQLAVICAGLLVAAYFFYCFFLVTRGGMREVTKHIDAVAAGDLSTTPRPWGTDEAAALMTSIDHMQSSLRTLIGQVRECADTIVTTSAEVSAGADDLASRTEQSSSRLQETASAMEQIAATVQQTAERTDASAALGRENSAAAAQGGEVIAQVVATMHQIDGSSRKIGEIIGVIDSIAFQTNILALNAAVEAARAGEQGRGFAVVATEVRALAQRSASAARDIKALIGTSAQQTAQGSQVVRSAGATMNQLVHNAQRMSGLLAEVASAATEQTRGVSAVSSTVAQLDQDTQRNAALVEQTNNAASAMTEKANQLVATARRFTLPGDVSHA